MSATDSSAEQVLDRADEVLCRAQVVEPNWIESATHPERA